MAGVEKGDFREIFIYSECAPRDTNEFPACHPHGRWWRRQRCPFIFHQSFIGVKWCAPFLGKRGRGERRMTGIPGTIWILGGTPGSINVIHKRYAFSVNCVSPAQRQPKKGTPWLFVRCWWDSARPSEKEPWWRWWQKWQAKMDYDLHLSFITFYNILSNSHNNSRKSNGESAHFLEEEWNWLQLAAEYGQGHTKKTHSIRSPGCRWVTKIVSQCTPNARIWTAMWRRWQKTLCWHKANTVKSIVLAETNAGRAGTGWW